MQPSTGLASLLRGTPLRPRRRVVTGTLLAIVLSVMLAPSARAQSATLNGFVTDAANGEALEFVNVVLDDVDDPDAELRGTVTNRDGLYLIPRIPAGPYVLQASFIGFDAYVDTLLIEPGETRTVNIALAPASAELDEVVVQTERTAGAARVTAGQQTVRARDIELVPAPDVAGDLVTYLTTLPGVVATGDRGGQLFIRGGEPSQNLVQLDGMMLYQPFHILGFYSAFPADIISRADIYAGGYGSKFGERISSVIDVWTRQGNNRAFAGAVSASPFVSTLRLEGPIVPGRVSFLGSVRQSMIEQTAEPLIDQRLPFDFADAFAKIHAEVTSRSRLSASGLFTRDRGTLSEASGTTPAEEVRWTNQAGSLRYLHLPRILPISAELRLAHSRLQTELGPTDAPTRRSEISNTQLTLDGVFIGDRVDVESGLALRFITSESELGGLFQNAEVRGSGIDHFALYVEPEFKTSVGLRVRPGVRLQFYHMRIDPYLEPRLRLVWAFGPHEISGAAGYYQQEIIGLTDRRDAASIFTAWTNIPKFNPRQPDVLAERIPRAIHSILGYRTNPAPWLEVSVEGFYKWLDNLFISEWSAFPRFTTRLQPASGRSFGFDARVEFSRQPFYGYVNYGFSNTRYEAEQAALELWYGTETLSFRPPHDRRHQVNALLTTSAYGFDLSARWEFGSGLPFSRAIGFDGFVLIDDVVDVTKAPSSRRVIYERPYNGVLPTYHRLDLSVERTFEFGLVDVTALGSLINVYDRRNLFFLDVFTLQRVDQLPFVPSIGLRVSFN